MSRATNNGDGIIPPEATSNPDLAQFIISVMDTIGSTNDASGKPGISKEQLEEFSYEAEIYLTWKAKDEIPKGNDTTEIMHWGTETPQAYNLLTCLEKKIEQYFAQCAMVRFDERAVVQMQLRQKELEEIDFTDKSMIEARLKDAPLSVPNQKNILDLNGIINLLYVEQLSDLKEKVLKRALGESIKHLTQKQWNTVKAIFAPYRVWLESKQGAKVEKLGADKLCTYLNGPYRKQVSELIAKDLAVANDLDQIHNLKKLILYQRWLVELANNFVSFANLYNPQLRSLFEMGTLVVDGRQITFTMGVQNRQAHKKIAESSYMYLLYTEITGRQNKDIKFEIVAPVTSGSVGRLRIGKRGIFFTKDGQEWDAEAVDIMVNPISIWESVKAPFQQFTGFIKKQIDRFTKSSQNKLGTTLSTSSASSSARDFLLVGGVAIASLGAALAYITKALSQVKLIHLLGTLLGLVTIVLLPSIIIGFAKIYKRDMSAFLEASGWAVNVHMRLNAALGRLFTHIPCLPKGARKERRDVVAQFAKEFGYTSFQPKRLITVILTIVLILLFGLILLLIKYPELNFLSTIFK